MVKLQERFGGRVRVAFGVGTNLTNDLGLEPLNVVMKVEAANGHPAAKLSDVPGKHTGPPDVVAQYLQTGRSSAATS